LGSFSRTPLGGAHHVKGTLDRLPVRFHHIVSLGSGADRLAQRRARIIATAVLF
jgi:hypothetical protein